MNGENSSFRDPTCLASLAAKRVEVGVSRSTNSPAPYSTRKQAALNRHAGLVLAGYHLDLLAHTPAGAHVAKRFKLLGWSAHANRWSFYVACSSASWLVFKALLHVSAKLF